MTLGSLFDGIGGWQIAAVRNDITPLWSSETEKFPQKVTAKHFPATTQLGDVNDIDGGAISPVDIICAGSPCQNLSVAGRQEGLKGAKSGLFYRAVDIVRQMQRATANKYPRFFVWENVPGAFGSNRGFDFRAVLEAIGQAEIPMPKNNKWANAGMVECDKCQIAWRTLDAQYWGVPQRRKRIFLVADFRAFGRCAAQILFEQTGMRGNIATGGGKGQGTADRFQNGSASPSGGLTLYDNHGQDSRITGPLKIAPCLNAKMGTGGNNTPLVMGTAFCIAGNTIDRKLKNGGNGKGVLRETSYTLNTVDRHAVAYGIGRDAFNQGENARYDMTICKDIQPTLVAKGAGAVYVPEGGNKTIHRLTPLECERLQGLPDNYTLIADKSCSDSARYKALGNGMAQPCADWILRRIGRIAQ